jgi:hypothetical protein
MSQIEINNLLDGKRLCNTLASILVNKFEEVTPGCKTELTVFNHRSFFIVNGFTTSKQTVNILESFRNYLSEFKDSRYETVKVIDIINFVDVLKTNPINLNFTFDKLSKKVEKSLLGFVNNFFDSGVKINLKFDYDNKIILFNSDSDNNVLSNVLRLNYPNYKLIEFNFENLDYHSERKYGLSNGIEKYYSFLGDYISNHIFAKSLSDNLSFSIYSDELYSNIDSENIIFKINNDNHVVKTEWMESMILDIFPFDEKSLSDTFGNKNIEEKIEELDLLNEIILF